MITLITGLPGSGKTAQVVKLLMKEEGRPVFVMGIPELTLPHEAAPPIEEWTERRQSEEDASIELPYFTFPEGSLLVVDEAQRIYRPRSAGSKVPDIVAALETHRHTGIDIWLVTQHPGLIDANIRKLITRHFHIHVTPFGRFLLEWAGIGEPDNKASRELARRDRYKPDPAVFDKYKSAELHTKVKARLPWYFYLFIFALLSFFVAVYYVWHRISTINAQASSTVTHKLDDNLKGQGAPSRVSGGQIRTSQEYVAYYTERLDGLPHTAPAYDEITKPVAAPVPVGCVKYEDECRCLTQQGTIYQTTRQLCLQMLKQGPFFMPWKPDRNEVAVAQVDQRSESPRVSVHKAPGNPPEWLKPHGRASSVDTTANNPSEGAQQPMQGSPMQSGRNG
jgi:zona occludens toxin